MIYDSFGKNGSGQKGSDWVRFAMGLKMLRRKFLLLSALGALGVLTGVRITAARDGIVIRDGWILLESDLG